MMWGREIRQPIRSIDMAYVYGIRRPRRSFEAWADEHLPRVLQVLAVIGIYAALIVLTAMWFQGII